MKARIKKTGELVQLAPYARVYEDYAKGRSWLVEELEDAEDIDYWTRLEHQYAGMFLQAQISYGEQEKMNSDEMVEDAMIYAHKLVEKQKLKEKEERK